MKTRNHCTLAVLPLVLLVLAFAGRWDGHVDAHKIRGNALGHRRVVSESTAENEVDRFNIRRLQVSKAKDDSSTAADSASDSDGKDDKKAAKPSKTDATEKGSIASRTSNMPLKRETPSAKELGIQFTKPETNAPTIAPPTVTPVSNSTKPAAASKKSSSDSDVKAKTNSTSTTPASAPTRTNAPTTFDVGSIASQTSTMDKVTKAPYSSSMEFVTPETSAPRNETYFHAVSNNTEIETTSNSTSTGSSSKSTTRSNSTDDDFSAFVSVGLGDDEFVPGNSSSKIHTLVLPKEKDQPKNWPEFVGFLFVLGAFVFFGMTAFKTYRKRKGYEPVPISVSV